MSMKTHALDKNWTNIAPSKGVLIANVTGKQNYIFAKKKKKHSQLKQIMYAQWYFKKLRHIAIIL